MLYLSTKDKDLGNKLMYSIRQSFRYDSVIYWDEEFFNCEIEFDSRWIFPQKAMEKLTKDIPQGNDLYIRVLSIV
jgi:hypothetical protein